MTTLPGPSLGIISAHHISCNSTPHTDLLIISISGVALKDFSDRLSANDSNHDGGWEKENTACHFDSYDGRSSRVATCQSLDSCYIPPQMTFKVWSNGCPCGSVSPGRTPDMSAEPWAEFFAPRSQTLEPSSPHSDTCFTVVIEHGKSDLKYSRCPRSDVSSKCSFYVILHSVSLVFCFSFL